MTADELLAKLIKDYGIKVVNELSDYMDENLPLINEIEQIEKDLTDQGKKELYDRYKKLVDEGYVLEVNRENVARLWAIRKRSK